MSKLSDQQFKHTQNYLDACVEALDPLVITPHKSLHDWKALLSTAPKVSGLAKPFDPDLHPNMQGFWFSLDYQGEPIACAGGRLFECHDFVQEWVVTDRMAGTLAPRMDMAKTEYADFPERLSGRVVLCGGSWVHPAWRGFDLSAATSRISKLFSLRHLLADHCVAFIRQDRDQWARETLGWPSNFLLSTGEHSTRDDFIVDVTMHHMSASQVLRQSAVAPLSTEALKRLESARLLAKLTDDTNAQHVQSAV